MVNNFSCQILEHHPPIETGTLPGLDRGWAGWSADPRDPHLRLLSGRVTSACNHAKISLLHQILEVKLRSSYLKGRGSTA